MPRKGVVHSAARTETYNLTFAAVFKMCIARIPIFMMQICSLYLSTRTSNQNMHHSIQFRSQRRGRGSTTTTESPCLKFKKARKSGKVLRMRPVRDLWPILNTEGLGSYREVERKNGRAMLRCRDATSIGV